MIKQFEQLSFQVIGCAIEVHRVLGPGLLESAYEVCLARELQLKAIGFTRQQALRLIYKGLDVDCGYRADLVVEKKLIVELKAVERVLELHQAQLLSYMRLTGIRVGLLINFNVPVLRDGLQRIVL